MCGTMHYDYQSTICMIAEVPGGPGLPIFREMKFEKKCVFNERTVNFCYTSLREGISFCFDFLFPALKFQPNSTKILFLSRAM